MCLRLSRCWPWKDLVLVWSGPVGLEWAMAEPCIVGRVRSSLVLQWVRYGPTVVKMRAWNVPDLGVGLFCGKKFQGQNFVQSLSNERMMGDWPANFYIQSLFTFYVCPEFLCIKILSRLRLFGDFGQRVLKYQTLYMQDCGLHQTIWECFSDQVSEES